MPHSDLRVSPDDDFRTFRRASREAPRKCENGGGPLITTLTTTLPTYDPSGNQIASDTYAQSYSFTSGGTDFFANAATGESFVRNYYDASERLRVSQRSYFFTDPGSNPRYRATFQEYFYDALGRRIAMRSRRDSTCTDTGDPTPGWDCAQTMERYAWDGDQLLVEARDYGWWGADPSTLNGFGLSAGSGNFYGAATYSYALNLFGPDAPLLLVPPSGGTVIPEASWRGNYEDGTAPDGSDISGSSSYNWPGQRTDLYLAPDARIAPIIARKWFGSIVEGKVDPSGLVYDRNRYYDPTAGRFTQEDPAGIGGGLNLYGYAGGDPANNTDPFGLWPDWGTVASASAGFGDALLFGFGPALRSLARAGGSVDMGSRAYVGGEVAGTVALMAATAGVGEAAAAPKIGSAGGPGAGKDFSEAVKDAARAESGDRCVFCGDETVRSKTPEPNRSNIDHAIPKSRGGNNTIENAQNTCQTCNSAKGTKTTEEYQKANGRPPLASVDATPVPRATRNRTPNTSGNHGEAHSGTRAGELARLRNGDSLGATSWRRAISPSQRSVLCERLQLWGHSEHAGSGGQESCAVGLAA
ncbi:MAG TPA: RHS repeat-associated core domain-containing protein [Gemmatimonadaceae bacterium]